MLRKAEPCLQSLSGFSPNWSHQADHLVQRGRRLVQQESMDLDVPEEKIPKRASAEILEAERLEDLETCMVGDHFVFCG